MSKRKYRTTDVKSVDWHYLRQSTEGSKLIFAVDAAKEKVVGALMSEDKRVIVTMKWKHPVESRSVIRHLCDDLSCARVEMVMEPSGTYGDVLLWQLRQAGIALYRVSPKRVHDAAEVYDGVPSLHDAKAARSVKKVTKKPGFHPPHPRRAGIQG